MDEKSRALLNIVCTSCGLISDSAKDGLCMACHELLLTSTVRMVDEANQTEELMTPIVTTLLEQGFDVSEETKAQQQHHVTIEEITVTENIMELESVEPQKSVTEIIPTEAFASVQTKAPQQHHVTIEEIIETENIAEVENVETETKASAVVETNNSTTKTTTSMKLGKIINPTIKKKQKNRCLTCHKKIGLYVVQCRCGGIYCAYHRYSDRHDCKFDYRALGAAEIRRNNPRVIAKKINKF